MHSSPIDLVARAPKPQKATPTETESDGRFSELLRGPSKADAKQPDVSANPKSEQAASVDDPAGSGTEITSEAEAPVEPAAEPATPEIPAATEISPNQLTNVPEAIATTQPVSALPFIGDAESPQMQAGLSSAPAPRPGDAIVAPPPVPETVGAQVPTGSANGAMPAPQPHSPAIPVNPAVRANPAHPENPAKPETLGSNARMTQSSPTADTQSATTGPVMPAGKAITGGDTAGETIPTPAAARPRADAVDAAKLDRPIPTATAAPERPAMTRVPAPAMAEPPKSPDVAVRPETRGSKAGSQPMRTMPNTATPATTSSASEISSAAATTAVPSTVSEIADTPLPASQPDSNAAATPGQVGRMTATTAPAIQGAHTQTAAQPAAEQVVLRLQRAVREGVDRLTIQLKPASLGRVDVQMEVGYDGRVQAIISAERPETLHLLQRDARALTEALNDAGLQTDSGSLSFNLRGQSGDHAGGNARAPSDAARAELSNTEDDIDQAATQITLTLGDGRVDIKV